MLKDAKTCPQALTPPPVRPSATRDGAALGRGYFVEDSMPFIKLAVRPKDYTVDDVEIYFDTEKPYRRSTIAEVRTPLGDPKGHVYAELFAASPDLLDLCEALVKAKGIHECEFGHADPSECVACRARVLVAKLRRLEAAHV